MNERLGQRHPLPIALRQFTDELAVHRPQTTVLDHPGLALPESAPTQAARPPDKIKICPDFHIRVEWQHFREIADELAHLIRLVANAFPAHCRLAKSRVEV